MTIRTSTVFASAILFAGAAGFAQTAPGFKSTWKADLPAGARRIGVADVAGDMKPRLLALGEGSVITVYSLAGERPVKEAAIELGKDVSFFMAGRFAKDKPACIVINEAAFSKNGDKYDKKKLEKLPEANGFVRFADGTENVFNFAGGPPQASAVDPSAAQPVTDGHEMPNPTSDGGIYTYAVVHVPAEVMAGHGIPEEAHKVGIFGLIAAGKDAKLYGFLPWNGKESSHFVLFDVATITMNNGGEFKALWKSPKLTGTVVDITIGGDPKTGKGVGFYLLTATGADGKGRQVEYFAPE